MKFTKEEQLIIYEAALMSLSNRDFFYEIADHLDLSDEEIIRVRKKLEQFMQEA